MKSFHVLRTLEGHGRTLLISESLEIASATRYLWIFHFSGVLFDHRLLRILRCQNHHPKTQGAK